ncbi:hypothetical protein JCM19239_4576 [Vibrio variabilis]|uniref:Uncharacterized protein n=1 Tax=Vibrio variabilis TaxID=990271 RepID=A0ABQ0J7Y4_9VIBR|nr:hypothetical protein JCM19239_4576 [Vibrio variabilis]
MSEVNTIKIADGQNAAMVLIFKVMYASNEFHETTKPPA